MPIVFIPNESTVIHSGIVESRVAATPKTVKGFARAGVTVHIESNAGQLAGFADVDYQNAGAEIVSDRMHAIALADLILYVNRPTKKEIDHMQKNAIVVGHLAPFTEQQLVNEYIKQGVSAISVEMVPRTTRAQRMDALSSMANLAGYVMVIEAAKCLNRIMPLMMTPAGRLGPAKVFVIGAGVAGLQAIATARRLGASVLAFDTRAIVAEQVESLGAKFLKIDLGETGQTSDGYATALAPAQIELQKAGQKKAIADADIVITTAQLFGRKPPLLISQDMIADMKPGGVIVDMAAEDGGNVEGSVTGQTTLIHDVHVIGMGNWSNQVPRDASYLYANNVFHLVETFYNESRKDFIIDFDDDILKGCVIAHEGVLRNDMLVKHYQQQQD